MEALCDRQIADFVTLLDSVDFRPFDPNEDNIVIFSRKAFRKNPSYHLIDILLKR